MDKILVRNIFAAVFEKPVLDPLLELFKVRLTEVRFWGTEGTIVYIKSKGFKGKSVVQGFDYGGRVKSLDRANFVRILADKFKKKHLAQLKKEGFEPIDAVIVDLYEPDRKNFPESMDIGGQALIRAAIKNYKNAVVAYDASSLASLVSEMISHKGSTSLSFRKTQAAKAARFIAQRVTLEATLFSKV